MKTNALTNFISKHKVSIGIASSAAVYIGSIVWTAKGTIKAVRAYDKKCYEMGVDKLSPVDTVKVSAKYYVGPTVCAVAGTAISAVTGIAGEKRSEKLMDAAKKAYTVSQVTKEKLEAYKTKTEEVVGSETATEISRKAEEAATNQVINNYISNSVKGEYHVAKGKGGDYLYYDKYIGRFFTSDDNTIDSALRIFNAKLDTGEELDLNEFYEELELEPVEAGNSTVYSIAGTGHMRIEKNSILIPNGNGATCATISFPDMLPY